MAREYRAGSFLVKRTEKEALKRLIEYARVEAEEQRESFTAYLLTLATRTLDSPLGTIPEIEPTLSRMQ
jgi:hypothetical protein